MTDTTVGLTFNDEDALISALRSGAEEAYESLILKYQQPVYNLVYRLVNDAADANDVVQEVFLKIFRNIRNFRGGSSLKTWIYRIAVNEAHNQRRWFSRHQRPEIGFVAEDSQGPHELNFPDTGRSPFDLAVNEEARELLEEALGKLNPKFRTAVVLRDIEELSYEEIAAVLELSLGTVKSRIMRGRETLRRTLEERLEAEQRANFGRSRWNAGASVNI
ncbi:MAG TPA: sigma-70 family RNA polymerase sigma factor [Bryobacteraceae bacterium]|nr:sigma-70 family RNA polymerase sigma factor [Bryobacteraceae bacterium]